MKRVLIVLFALLLLGLFSGCSDSSSTKPLKMQDLEVPEGFTFETTQLITVMAHGVETRTLTISKETGEVVYKGLLTAEDGFNQNILVATSIKKLVFKYNNEEQTFDISPNQGCITVYFSDIGRSRETLTDSDGDGVQDDEDDFPNDPTLAYRVQYPPQPQDSTRCCYRNYSSLAFEDLWPDEGDYDFNDVIINYQIDEWLNYCGNVRHIDFNMYYSVDGAGYNNGFYVKVPFDETGVAEVSYPDTFPGREEGFDYFYDTENGGDGNLVLQFFEQAHSYMPDPPEFHNTEEGSPFTEPLQFILNVELYDSDVYNPRPAQDYPPYNPFLVINREEAREVHFGNYPPTGNVSAAYFGTGDDTSDPATDRYYLTAGDLVWGMHIPDLFDNALERVSILDAYPQFAGWVISGGNDNADWYDYPVEENVYDFVDQFEDFLGIWWR